MSNECIPRMSKEHQTSRPKQARRTTLTILRQIDDESVRMKTRQLRTGIVVSGMDEPPHRCDDKDTDQDDTVVVHRRDGSGHSICLRSGSARVSRDSCGSGLTEAEHDVEENDQEHGDAIDCITRRAHPKRTSGNVFPSGEHVRSDCEGV